MIDELRSAVPPSEGSPKTHYARGLNNFDRRPKVGEGAVGGASVKADAFLKVVFFSYIFWGANANCCTKVRMLSYVCVCIFACTVGLLC